jgi:hypothetical protein
LKSLRTNAIAALKALSDSLHKLSEREGGVDKRRSLAASAENAISQVSLNCLAMIGEMLMTFFPA